MPKSHMQIKGNSKKSSRISKILELIQNVENLVFYQKRKNNGNMLFVTRYVVIKGVKSVSYYGH